MNYELVPTTLWLVVKNATFMSQIVLFLAVITLTISLVIAFYKLFVLRIHKKQAEATLRRLQNLQSIDDIMSLGAALKGTLPGIIVRRGTSALKLLSKRITPTHAEGMYSHRDMDLLHDALEQSLQEVIFEQYHYLGFLSVAAAVAPLVGLFGTVSGLVRSFMNVGALQTADLGAIAPGIAEALLTTLAGLFVAIPCLLLFYYVKSKVTDLEYTLTSLTHRFAWMIEYIGLEEEPQQ